VIRLRVAIVAILMVAGVVLAAFAFHLQRIPDWPGLLINLSAGFIGAALIFVLVDLLLRGREEHERDKLRYLSELRVGEQAVRRVAVVKLADMNGLINCDLRGINLEGLSLKGFDFSGADLVEARIFGADLPGAKFIGSNLRGADMRGAVLTAADLRSAVLDDADLQGAHLEGARLQGASFKGCDLRGANLIGADFDDAALRLGKVENIIR